ncbi:MAG: MaoC family dehydratase N-terminal domain-containing protein [Deltaproteobacteria bacterium]|nr:MaoC family dehydratase N-terminal domain-containing protein [Deltaproteobacteria bacterium]
MAEKYWEDFDVGFSFKTPSITVTESHIVTWAGLTMDFYPLHVDAEYAKKTVFKERIAHGPLIFGLAVGLAAQARIEGGAVMAWMGVDNMRMLAPVRIGDTVTVNIEVTQRKETKKDTQGIQIWKYSVHNQRDEVVLVFDMNFLMHRRPAV